MPWLRTVFLATVLVFVGVAVYIYGFRFYAWLESDAAVPALLADRALAAGSPVVADWYYANGDVWVLAPHLLAMITVAIQGLGPTSLFASVVAGFVLELAAFTLIFRRLGEHGWLGVFAAAATLMAWSSTHVAYVYIQLAYGFVACLYLLVFHWFGVLGEDKERGRSWRIQLVCAGVLVALVALQNPTRALVYVVAPFVVVTLWPWQVFVRRRLLLAAVVGVGWAVAWLVYTYVFADAVTRSVPRGHLAYEFAGGARLERNATFLGEGLLLLGGGGVRAIPGLLVLAGAVALVVRKALSSRELSARRFVSVIVAAQFFIVLALLIVGNLLTDPESVRYLMPSTLALVGIAVVVAVRTVAYELPGWWNQISAGWLIALPIAGAIAATNVEPPVPRDYEWPDAAELERVADALQQRGLTHGFAINLEANLLTLDSGGRAHTCRVTFADIMMPQRWLDDTTCYTASMLPERFYVVTYQNDHDRAALRATLPPAIELFNVGPVYEVHVYRTAEASPAWLDLPVPDGELATFPLRLPATHLQLRRGGNAAVESGDVVATGGGELVRGPYLDLPKGDYQVRWIGNVLASNGNVAFRATARKERDVVAEVIRGVDQLPTARGDLVTLTFSLPRRQNVEFPIEILGGAKIALHELVIEKKKKP